MKKKPELHFHPLLPSSIVLQPDQDTITGLCKAAFKGHKDGCPNYNRNWSCPPNSPKFNETADKIKGFESFWLVYIIIPLPKHKMGKILTKFGVNNLASIQTLYLQHFLDFLKQQHPDSVVFHASHCTLCKERGYDRCTFPDEVCRFPKQIRISPEAGGVDLFKTMQKAGLKFEMIPTTYVTRVGLIGSNGNLSISALKQEFSERFHFN